jgi:mono/diheme cytochrome c family protein
MRIPALVLAIAVVLPWSAQAQRPNAQDFEMLERGRYLTIAGDCIACHTIPGGIPFAGGRPIQTPFGVLLGPNLTPDIETGIGAWTDDQFARAMQQGIGRAGEHLYPAFPYPYYTRVGRNDVLAIRAYLDTLDPVRNPVRPNQLPFPFDIRASLIAWNRLFFKPGEFRPNPGKTAEWNRGAYLVEGLGHCGACHTPKNVLGGDTNSEYLRGNELQGWFAPSLTSDVRAGLGSWPIEAVVEYLKTGRNEFTASSGPMGEVISYTTSQLTDDDLWAIAAYLKDQPAAGPAAPQPVAAGDATMKLGQAIYVDACAACHTMGGAGIARLFPALKGMPTVQQTDPASLIRVVLQGTRAVATDAAPTGPAMPAFGWKLSDDQAAAVLTYIRNAWGNAAAAVSAGSVASARKNLAEGLE